MDLRYYFDPVSFERYRSAEKFSKHTLGFTVERQSKIAEEGEIGKIAVALIGVPDDRNTLNKGTAKAPHEIRKYLYGLSNFDAAIKIIDLGDLKLGKSEQDVYFALRDVVEYLKDNGIITVVLGGGQDLTVGITRAFKGDPLFTLSLVDSRVDIKTSRQVSDSSNFISRLLRDNPQLFHLQIIGLQSHWVPPAILTFLREQTFDYIHLGQLRDNFSATEPVLRNTGFLSFDISAIKQSDAAGHMQPSPNGLYGEEACQLARYAGLSNRLMAFGIFEVNPTVEKSGLTAGLAAQMIWYFIEAISHRKNDDPAIDKTAFTRYFVEMEQQGETLVFYHHPSTNRWWIEIFWQEGESWIIACPETDYQYAIRQEIPDIWWKYARKTDRFRNNKK